MELRHDEIKAFHDAVNMTASELERWLERDESKSVGQVKEGTDEAVGHVSGRHIVELLHKRQAEYDDADYGQMQRTVSYVKRHSAQRPEGEITSTHLRYSLMNWGHDPLKD